MDRFFRFVFLIMAFGLMGGFASSAGAKVLRVGLVSPDSGSLALLGQQLKAGFFIQQSIDIQAREHVELVEKAEICEGEKGAEIAQSLIEANVDIVFGFLCVESLVTALPILTEHNIPVVNLNIRSDIVRNEANRLDWLLFNFAPRASEEAKFVSNYIINHWGDKAVALVEDGTITNRELADSVRLQLEEGGFQPVVLDNFRPGQDRQFGLARRLAKSKITHVFIGGSRADTAIIAHNAIEINHQLTFLGSDALQAADEDKPLPDGVLAVLSTTEISGDDDGDIRSIFDAVEIFPDRFPLLGYASAQIALALAQTGEEDMIKALSSQVFDTIIGRISFDQSGDRKEDTYRTMVWRNGSFGPEDIDN